MTRRQNLVLFFEEKIQKISINNGLLRSYMNYFVIDENAETEINAEFTLNEFDNIEDIVIEAVEISKPMLQEETFTHFIIGAMLETIIANKHLRSTGRETRHIQQLAEYYWCKNIPDGKLICTSLTGCYDGMKTKTELKENQCEFSIGDDLEVFTKLVNDNMVEHLVGTRFLFLNQMLNSNNEFLYYCCSRYTDLIDAKKENLTHSLITRRLKYESKLIYFGLAILIIFILFDFFVSKCYFLLTFFIFLYNI